MLITSGADQNEYDSHLKFNKLRLINEGQIKINARNSEGEATCTVKLLVKG